MGIQKEYLSRLTAELQGTHAQVLTDDQRTELRVFRLRNGINSSAHLSALKKLGWTVDEFEVNKEDFLPLL